MAYAHTQSKPELTGALIAAVVGTTIWATVLSEPMALIAAIVLAVVAVIAYALSSLTTRVTRETITVAFRWGWPRRVITRSQVERVEVVRNRWWYGWGIRWVPGGTMYNVWGLDAVHLGLIGTRDFRIGTDDPLGLAGALARLVASDD